VHAVREALLRNDTQAMMDAITDEMVDTFAVAGTPDDVRRKLAPYVDLADSICLTPPGELIDPAETARYRQAIIETFGQ